MTNSNIRLAVDKSTPSNGAVRIFLEARSDNKKEKAAISIEMDNPDNMVDKVLDVLAAKFPISTFYEVLSNREEIVKQAVQNANSPTAVSNTVRENLYEEIMRAAEPGLEGASPTTRAVTPQLKQVIREALAELSVGDLIEVTNGVSPRNTKQLARELMSRVEDIISSCASSFSNGKWEEVDEAELIADRETEHSNSASQHTIITSHSVASQDPLSRHREIGHSKFDPHLVDATINILPSDLEKIVDCAQSSDNATCKIKSNVDDAILSQLIHSLISDPQFHEWTKRLQQIHNEMKPLEPPSSPRRAAVPTKAAEHTLAARVTEGEAMAVKPNETIVNGEVSSQFQSTQDQTSQQSTQYHVTQNQYQQSQFTAYKHDSATVSSTNAEAAVVRTFDSKPNLLGTPQASTTYGDVAYKQDSATINPMNAEGASLRTLDSRPSLLGTAQASTTYGDVTYKQDSATINSMNVEGASLRTFDSKPSLLGTVQASKAYGGATYKNEKATINSTNAEAVSTRAFDSKPNLLGTAQSSTTYGGTAYPHENNTANSANTGAVSVRTVDNEPRSLGTTEGLQARTTSQAAPTLVKSTTISHTGAEPNESFDLKASTTQVYRTTAQGYTAAQSGELKPQGSVEMQSLGSFTGRGELTGSWTAETAPVHLLRGAQVMCRSGSHSNFMPPVRGGTMVSDYVKEDSPKPSEASSVTTVVEMVRKTLEDGLSSEGEIDTNWLTLIEQTMQAEKEHMESVTVPRLRDMFMDLRVPTNLKTEIGEEHAKKVLIEHKALLRKTVRAVKSHVYRTIEQLLTDLRFQSNVPSLEELPLVTEEEARRELTTPVALAVYHLVVEATVRLAIVTLADCLNVTCDLSSPGICELLSIPVENPYRQRPEWLTSYLAEKRAIILRASLNRGIDEIPWGTVIGKEIILFVDYHFARESDDKEERRSSESIMEVSEPATTTAPTQLTISAVAPPSSQEASPANVDSSRHSIATSRSRSRSENNELRNRGTIVRSRIIYQTGNPVSPINYTSIQEIYPHLQSAVTAVEVGSTQSAGMNYRYSETSSLRVSSNTMMTSPRLTTTRTPTVVQHT